jgi:hypothetical protein
MAMHGGGIGVREQAQGGSEAQMRGGGHWGGTMLVGEVVARERERKREGEREVCGQVGCSRVGRGARPESEKHF